METIDVIGRLAVFVILLAFPQFLGLLVHFRIRNYPRLVYFIGFAVTMITSFSLLQIIFVQPIEGACGLAIMAQLVFFSFFFILEAVGSVIAQSWFHRKYRR